MKRLLDKTIILVCCILLMIAGTVTWINMLALLIIIIISALYSSFPNKWLKAAIIGCTVACCFSAEFFIFIPLLVYDFAGFEVIWLRFIPVIPIVARFSSLQPLSPLSLGMLIIYCIIAIVLDLRTREAIHNLDEYYNLQDISKESSLNLERRNKELREKQDYEVRLATLKERNRIAREIHDNVGHLLTRSILQVGAMSVVHKEDSGISENLSGLKETLSDAMDSIRSSVHDLHDESIDLRMQIYSIIEDFKFCEVKFNYNSGEMSKSLKYCFISVVKEALSNITKHSNATQASIKVAEHPAFFQLIIEDNGNLKPSDGLGEGIGLKNMAERVEAFKGTFYVDSSKGFKIFISVPK